MIGARVLLERQQAIGQAIHLFTFAELAINIEQFGDNLQIRWIFGQPVFQEGHAFFGRLEEIVADRRDVFHQRSPLRIVAQRRLDLVHEVDGFFLLAFLDQLGNDHLNGVIVNALGSQFKRLAVVLGGFRLAVGQQFRIALNETAPADIPGDRVELNAAGREHFQCHVEVGQGRVEVCPSEFRIVAGLGQFFMRLDNALEVTVVFATRSGILGCMLDHPAQVGQGGCIVAVFEVLVVQAVIDGLGLLIDRLLLGLLGGYWLGLSAEDHQKQAKQTAPEAFLLDLPVKRPCCPDHHRCSPAGCRVSVKASLQEPSFAYVHA